MKTDSNSFVLLFLIVVLYHVAAKKGNSLLVTLAPLWWFSLGNDYSTFVLPFFFSLVIAIGNDTCYTNSQRSEKKTKRSLYSPL